MIERSVRHSPPRSSKDLLRAIAEAQEVYDRRYRDLVGADLPGRDEDDVAASWVTLLGGSAPIAKR